MSGGADSSESDSAEFEQTCSFHKELESYPRGTGVLWLHVLDGRNIVTDSTQPYTNYALRVQVGGVSKGFKAVAHNHGSPVWDQSVHIPVTVYQNAANPMNYIIFSLFAQGNFPDEESQIVGTVNVHLHDVVGARHAVKCVFLLKSFDAVVGEICVKMQFFYGLYGYGHSMQLSDDLLYAQAQVQESLYPYVKYVPKPEPSGDKPDRRQERVKKLCQQSIWFKNVEYVLDSVLTEKSQFEQLLMLRQIVAGDFQTSEIPPNLDAVEMSNLSRTKENEDLIPVAARLIQGRNFQPSVESGLFGANGENL